MDEDAPASRTASGLAIEPSAGGSGRAAASTRVPDETAASTRFGGAGTDGTEQINLPIKN